MERSRKIAYEELWRIKLSHLKPLIKGAKELKKLPPEERKGKGISWSITYLAGEEEFKINLLYHLKPRYNHDTKEEIGIVEAVLFSFTTLEGERKEIDIELAHRESNLRRGYVEYYFVDGSYNLCRTLYTDRINIYGRMELRDKTVYLRQRRSRKYRTYDKTERAERVLSSLKGRHLTHKGRLTPIGAQAKKAEEVLDSSPDFFSLFEDKRRSRSKQAPDVRGINIAYD